MKGSINAEGGEGDADDVVREEKVGHERDDQSRVKGVTPNGLSSFTPSEAQRLNQGSSPIWEGMNHQVRSTQQSSPSKESASTKKSCPLKSNFLYPITKHTILRSVSTIKECISAKCAMPEHTQGGTRPTSEKEPTIKSPVVHSFIQANEKKSNKMKDITSIQMPAHRNVSTFAKRNPQQILKSYIYMINSERNNFYLNTECTDKKGHKNKFPPHILKERILNFSKRPRDIISKLSNNCSSGNNLEKNKKKIKVDKEEENDDVILLDGDQNLPCRSGENGPKSSNTGNNNLVEGYNKRKNTCGSNTFSFLKIPFAVKQKDGKITAKRSGIAIAGAGIKNKQSSANHTSGEKSDSVKNASFKKIFSAEEMHKIELNYDNNFSGIEKKEEEKVKDFYCKFYKCTQAAQKRSETNPGCASDAANLQTSCLRTLDAPSKYCKSCRKFLKLLISHGTKYKGTLVGINFIHPDAQNILYVYKCDKQHEFNLSLFHIMHNLWCPHDYCLFECKGKNKKSYATEFFRLKELDTMEKQKDLFLQAKIFCLVDPENALPDSSENAGAECTDDVERIIRNANDPWEVLQIKKFSKMKLCDKELKRKARTNYRALALKVHPDKNKSKNATLAMNILTNSMKAITSAWKHFLV
ncbi:DnaJ domain containing protein [Plasmodium cynomolgi strain B]|uniref:DnaJ domain containing protein n=1 Tax=Plasmodium cynomolgi (strain B) TaxID=1120755 RepID=K6UTE2_PLACD|nr:DnaJ domain containing protein [Plasmodium cynomolgi strain B]GAB66539.1 DnaJ domain containing protein [Plasmodium cynomolgi strain B]